MDNLQETLLIGGKFDGDMIEFDQDVDYITVQNLDWSETYNRQTIKCGKTEMVVLVAENCNQPLERLVAGYLNIS
tara:strand:- start:9723 stop:9947 length:225 start_codon:yes stop_codon:yes gene_type:complete